MTILYYYYHWILSFTVGLWDFPGLSLETENLITLNTANREFNDMYTSLGGQDVSRRPLRFYWTISYKSTALQLEVAESAWTLSTLLFLPYLLQAYAMYYILSVNNRRPCQNKPCSKMCWFMNKFQWNCSLLFWDAMSEKLIFQCVLFMVGWNTSFPQSAIDWSGPINKYK